ncbi:MAG: PDZ domain-containing protein [Vulcanimicrobiaceae bacterium]
MRLLVGRLVLTLLVAWAVVSLAVSAAFLWTPQGTLGLTADYGGSVTSVAPGSPAGKAGVRAGDRIVLSATPFESRPKLVGVTTPIEAGTVVPFRVARGTAERDVTLTAVDNPLGTPQRITLTIDLLSTVVFIVVGTLLILLRPSLVTWGFGTYCLLINPVIPAFSRFPSATAHMWYVGIYDVIQNIGTVGLIVFALNFPRPFHRWSRAALAAALVPLFFLLAAWTLWIDLAVNIFAIPVAKSNFALQLAFGVVDLLAIFLLTNTYLTGPKEDRPRLRWVLVGFYVGLVCTYAGTLLYYTASSSAPAWLDNLLIAMQVTLPIAVAYAVVRHRVIEIDFFFSRALVYAILTSVLVGVFAISDWLFGQVLEDFRLSLVLDALISIAAALSFDRAHTFLERSVDRIVFRGRQLAMDRMSLARRTFKFMTSPETIDETLVREPHEALGVATIALFRKEGNSYRRVTSVGWQAGNCAALDRDDRLVTAHLATEGVLHLSEIPWIREDAPSGLAAPVISIPLRAANVLTGMLICSLKPHGEQLDPEELHLLIDFSKEGAIAYDQLEADELRRHAKELETQVMMLDARLQEARRNAM